jgi:hypothetical protein
MREKILAELRKKYAGLPAHLLGLVADKLATKVTEDSQVEGAVGELENLPISLTDYAKVLQQEGDRRVTEAQKEFDKKNPKSDPPKNDPVPDDAPAWAKALINQVSEQSKTIQQLQQEKVQGSLQQRLAAILAEKKIPAQLANGRTIEKPEDLDTVVAAIESDYTALKQDMNNQGLLNMSGTPQSGSGGGVGGDTKTVEADIAAHFGKSEDKK